MKNNCNETIWPGILSGSGKPQLNNGGLKLNPKENATIKAPKGWSGRIWPRTGCTFDAQHRGNCTTGDCGLREQCNGTGGEPPVSLAEFTLDSPMDFYDVSLVDGFNIPVSIIPSDAGGKGNCSEVKCVNDLNLHCPVELQVRSSNGRRNNTIVACKNPCIAFRKPEYCCSGAFNNPNICKPSNYSIVFKRSCPRAYSYPYDDLTSTFTCKGANYDILFC
ncbi:hypothetical protein Leryth_001436 [Lithospermum erythrorhizon]|nr:hypothetical protein Leryth_001436 [Lithospermum erythrorhizon]